MRPLRTLLLAVSTLACCLAHGQTYPTKTITLLVAFPAGGQADAVARAIAPALQKELGQTVIVDNAAGVGGALGAQKVLGAAADGHTLMFGTPIELVQTPMAVAGAKYKPEDFRMIGPVASTYMMMTVRPDLPVASVADFVAFAKKSGAKELSFGSVGRGSAYHLVAERFAQDTGLQMLHVPYKGAQQLITDLAGGQIDMAFLPLGGPVPGLLQTGKFKAIGYTAASRHAKFPNTPTLDESKLVKDFHFDLWGALMVAKSVPEPVAAKLSAALNQALKQPQLRKDLEATGVQPTDPMDQARAAGFYASEIARYQRIGNAINLQPE
jgi:tripartite-type tricarboxylate transporter receptor subunit TctC